MTAFAIIAAVLTILAVAVVAWPLLRGGADAQPVAATVTAIGIPAAVFVVYLLVSNHDWRAAPSAPAGQPASSMASASVEEAVASLERKLAANPDNEEGWILLGSSYLSLDRPGDAATAYQKALDISGGRSTAARLGLAESRIVQDPASLTGPVGEEIEAVLAEEPQNAKALWYGGMRSLARGDTATTRQRWQALLALSPPDQVRQVIEGQLAQLEGGAGPVAAATPAEAAPPAAAASGAGITVAVRVSDAVRDRVGASAPLFIFVRDGAAPGPPLAVVRRTAGELPLEVRITDADLMLPGRSLANVKAANLVARVANGGDPIAKPGDVFGEAQWQAGSTGPVTILVDRVVGP